VTRRLWAQRPVEERVLLNPAFLALLLRRTVAGYAEESGTDFPLPLAFIALPITIHRSTREELPVQIRTSLPIWLQEHQFLREGFAARARAVAPAVWEALDVGLSHDLLRRSGDGLRTAVEPARSQRATSETEALMKSAYFVGRWLARAGDVPTTYLLWGVRP
jgi:ABC-three component (ABC-3C) system Middle Component 3